MKADISNPCQGNFTNYTVIYMTNLVDLSHIAKYFLNLMPT